MGEGSARDRLLCRDAAGTVALEAKPDRLMAGHVALAAEGPVAVGVWEAGPGCDVDVEVDEVFIVLAGAGSVTFSDGSAIDLRPGVVVRLHAGDETRWEITDRLRKLYVIWTAA